MFDEGEHQSFVISDREGRDLGLGGQFVKLARREVRQGIGFDFTPDQLHSIEFQGVWRQLIGTHAAADAHQPRGDGLAGVTAQSIPDQGNRDADG